MADFSAKSRIRQSHPQDWLLSCDLRLMTELVLTCQTLSAITEFDSDMSQNLCGRGGSRTHKPRAYETLALPLSYPTIILRHETIALPLSYASKNLCHEILALPLSYPGESNVLRGRELNPAWKIMSLPCSRTLPRT